ncbi:MAG: hypothetical protein WB760_18265, partial [Xanthobacteraceae bacterium]
MSVPLKRESCAMQTFPTMRRTPVFKPDQRQVATSAHNHPVAANATASAVSLSAGLYALDIGPVDTPEAATDTRAFPAVQVSSTPDETEPKVEILGGSGRSSSWLDANGGTILIKVPPGGGRVLVTSFMPPDWPTVPPQIEVRPLDRIRTRAAIQDGGGEVPTEVVLHIERQGDRRFDGKGWIGNLGQRLRIEAFSILPLNTLSAQDIEFRAFGPNGQETPWVTDARLCGTRGRALPITGFAIRCAPHLDGRFDVV